jgi:hypothetical protein
MEDSDKGACNKLIENLLHIRLHFVKVQQHIQHDSAPLIMLQGLGARCPCLFELPFEKAEVR